MDRQQLLRRLETAWRDFQLSHAGRAEEQLLEPGVTRKWLVRDILAHVTTWVLFGDGSRQVGFWEAASFGVV